MNKTYVQYIVISLLSLVYLFFFSSNLLRLTNLNPVLFNITSTIIVFFTIDICYKLYIKKYQLIKKEILFILISYLIVFSYFVFSKQIVNDPKINLTPIPQYFVTPSFYGYLLFIGNILCFIPLGFFYKRHNLKLSLLISILSISLINAVLYILKLNDLALGNIITHLIGFYIGYFYFLVMKKKSLMWNNFSFDLRLILTFQAILYLFFNLLWNIIN